MTDSADNKHNQLLFWGCFIALVTTSFCFIGRVFLVNVWGEQFDLDSAQAGRLLGVGIWPFAVSIILFSLVIDRIGYKTAMYFAFGGHVIYTIMAVSAFFVEDKNTAFQLVYWGSLIAALANGTVEAFINPVVATLYNKEKTKWLNILHAGWPGGLVLAGIITIFLGGADWWIKIAILLIPAITYVAILSKLNFPKSERDSAGVSYREMLQEFGILGAIVVSFLTILQVIDFLTGSGTTELASGTKTGLIALGVLMVAAFGIYTKSLGRPLMFILILIMMPLATTEIGTDAWISGIMEGVVGEKLAGWVLVYTSAIMLILRFYAGPIVKKTTPLGLLVISSILAIIGLKLLATAAGTMIIVAATLYGLGKTFFWPTVLGVVSEQTPKGGALTLNAISGIGMLAVGTLGTAYIGALQTKTQQDALVASAKVSEAVPGLIADGKVTALKEKAVYEIIKYDTVDDTKVKEMIAGLPEANQEPATKLVKEVRDSGNQMALGSMIIFPIIMLIGFLGILFYFRSKGGYKPIEIDSGGGSSSDD